MSYNCTGAEYIKGKLYIERDIGIRLLEEMSDNLPESNLLDCLCVRDPSSLSELVEIKNPTWCDTGSNYNYPEDFVKVLSHTKGKADIVLTWEGGDSLSGFRVEDGKVTQREVVMALGEELK